MGILLLAARRLGGAVLVLWLFGGMPALTHLLALAFLVVEGVWSLVEGRLAAVELARTRAERVRAATVPLDEATLAFVLAGKRWALVSIVYQAMILAAFALRADVVRASAFSIAGFVLYLTGAAIRGWAMTVMGGRFKSWSVEREAQGLVTSGPYALVRHPSYLGLLIMAMALPLVFEQPPLLLLVLLPLLMLVRRVSSEERLLTNAYGDDYRRFSERTSSRLVPFVW